MMKCLSLYYEFANKLPKSFHDLFNQLDEETQIHSLRCAYYILTIKNFNWTVASAALLHDIGKLYVPIEILNKKGKLTDREWEIIKKHPEYGENLISSMDLESEIKQIAMDMALYHHEKYNGSGYPFGLKKQEIPYYARLMTIIDIFDAMTSKRSYKNQYPIHQVQNMIKRDSGIIFDPNLTQFAIPKKIIIL